MKELRPAFLALLALSVTLMTTAWLYRHESQNARQEMRAQFDFDLRDVSNRIAQRVSAYEQMIRGVQGFCSHSDSYSREEFSTYIESLQLGADFSGVQGVGLAMRISSSELATHEASMHHAGFPNYHVYPIDPKQDIVTPITQVEPFLGRNILALGYNPYSDPIRRAAMDKARDSGSPTISSKLKFSLDKPPDVPPSFIMYAPIFRFGSHRNNLESRRANTVGWVYAPVRMAELMASLYGEHPPEIGIRVYDGVTISAETLLHDTNPENTVEIPGGFRANEYIEVAGHHWTIEARSLPRFTRRYGWDGSQIIALSGGFMSVLLAIVAWLMASSRTRAIELAKSMTKELRDSEERWKFALEGAGDGVWDRDLRTEEVFFSRRCREIFGYTENEFGNHRAEWLKRIHPDDLALAMEDTQSCVDGRKTNFSSEYRIQCKNGDWKWVLARGHVTSYDMTGKPTRLIGTISDISERKLVEERIRHMAQHDALTGLPNRALFFDRFKQALTLARRDQNHVALLFVDLDHFKPINDEYGHLAGDQVLQHVANLLRDSIRESDTVGRVGGDEFVILLPGISSASAARRVAKKIEEAMQKAVPVHNTTLQISASIGYAIYPEHGEDEESLMKAADSAMYRMKHKESGRAIEPQPILAAPDA